MPSKNLRVHEMPTGPPKVDNCLLIEPKLTLMTAITIARQMESAARENRALDASSNPVNALKFNPHQQHKVTGISKSYDGLPNDITADDMNDYFVNVSSSIANSFDRKAPVWRNPQSVYTFSFSNISVDNVCRHLNNLNEDSKLDVLSFDSKLLRLSAPCISASLSQMYNTSLKTGIVPNDWLFSRVTPVYKGKGDKCEKKNYRPIAVVCHIAKLIEKEVNSQFLSYLLEHDFYHY